MPDPHQLALTERLETLCAQFERDWKPDARPSVHNYVRDVPPADRASALRALLRRDQELIARHSTGSATEAEASPTVSLHDTAVSQRPDATSIEAQATLDQPPDEASTRPSATSVDGAQDPASSLVETIDTPVQLEPAQKIGRFELIRVLGQGAFGKVYRARDPQLDREVALKVPLRERLQGDEDIERFLREARAAATLRHPNICTIYEVGQAGNQPYIVMAFVVGKSLADLIEDRSEAMPARRIAKIVRTLALALESAHGKGVVHRDLKPANIMFDREHQDVVIMDFGLARRSTPGDLEQSQRGKIVGTPGYMSPEQASGNSEEVGPRSDIYSLGVILYELLCGQRPFRGGLYEVLGQVLHTEPEPPSLRKMFVDPKLEAICLKALAKSPAKRYQTMAELAEVLERYLEANPSETLPIPANLGESKTAVQVELPAEQRVGWPWVVAAGLLTVAIALGGWFLLRRPNPVATLLPDTAKSTALKPAVEPTTAIPAAGRVFRGHESGVLSVAFAPDGRRVVSGGADKTVRLWEVESATELAKLEGHTAPVQAVVWLHAGAQVISAAGGDDATVRLWDVPARSEVRQFKGHVPGNDLGGLAACFDRQRIVSGSGDGTITLWSLADGKKRTTWPDVPRVRSLALSGDNRRALIGGRDGTLSLWDVLKNEEIRKLGPLQNSISGVALSDNGMLGLSCCGGWWTDDAGTKHVSDDKTIRVWDLRTGKELRQLQGHTGTVMGVALSADDKQALSGSMDGTVRLWDVASGKELHCFTGHADVVNSVVFSPNGPFVLSGSLDRTLRLWALPTIEPPAPKEPETKPDPALTIAWERISNGRDLSGWSVDIGPSTSWQVVNGAIVAKAKNSNTNGWLLSDRGYMDFIFRCQFQLVGYADGGFGFRAERGEKIGTPPMHVAIKLRYAPTGMPMGALYVWQNTAAPPLRTPPLRSFDSWNDLLVDLRGQRLRVEINGQEVQNLDLNGINATHQLLPGLKRSGGRLGLQQFAGEVRYRDLQIKDLSAK